MENLRKNAHSPDMGTDLVASVAAPAAQKPGDLCGATRMADTADRRRTLPMSASGLVAWLSVAPGLTADGCLTFTWCLVERLRWDTSAVEAFHNAVTAVLTIRGAARAVAFYERAFGAEEIYRNTYPDGRIVAELAVGEARFRVADEAPEASNLSPEALGGTSVRLNLLVADPDGVAAVAIANGAIEVAPVADQSYGLRQGRLADPFGHHWLIGRPVAGDAGDWARTAAR